MRVWVCDERVCMRPLCRLDLQDGSSEIRHNEPCPGRTHTVLKPIEREPFQDERGGLVVEVRPGIRAMVLVTCLAFFGPAET